MTLVVSHVQREIILHGNIKCLHFLGLSANFRHGRVHGVLGLHEAVVLGPDLINNTGGVDSSLVGVPVDISALGGGLGKVVEIEDGPEL